MTFFPSQDESFNEQKLREAREMTKATIVGTEESPIKLNLGEFVAIGPHKFKIIVGGKLDNKGLEPIAELKRV